jgi:glyoxylase-like metal-dependent hydrolase (beta-lactamase superfamily II)
MLLRQLFDSLSWTYTYLVVDEPSKQALLIDPVLEKVGLYRGLIDELGLTLAHALDTHVHADHISALGKLHDLYGCETVHGEMSKAKGLTRFVRDNETIVLGSLRLKTLFTPGHTNDSYCFLLESASPKILFTGDTLLIRGTGRTDFQQGNARKQYDSIFRKLLVLDDDTLVYPGHDYSGMVVSTIREEKRFNPRLQVKGEREYSELMGNLKLARPKQMDRAVMANLNCGRL